VAFSRKGVVLPGSDVVVAGGVERSALSVAVTLGVPAERLLALQVRFGLDGVQVKPIDVSPL
jgi:hypothetical protein